jgi:deoxyribodipyrimidine photo-lyase
LPPVAVSLLWFRTDLRVDDNAALAAAVAHAAEIAPVFVWSPEEESTWAPGAASRWWLDRSLRALDASLVALGSGLIVRRGPVLDALRDVARETGATAVFWNRRYEPAVIARDAALKEALRADGLTAESFNSALLSEPWQNRKDDGTPYRVFTPFWNAMKRRGGVAEPVDAPRELRAPAAWPTSVSIDDLGLLPEPDWAGGMREAWTPGEAGARAELDRFLRDALADYETGRDRPGVTGTSRLSPHLHFGEVSPRRVWHAVRDLASDRSEPAFDAAAECWLRELGWREFAHHLLFHFPNTTDEPLRPEFARMEWTDDERALRAWQKGLTGYPIVDAGMRELWTTGWMHNRVRMIVASFLVKDLRVSWQQGSRWFWDTLVDADLANNTLGWQWTAGCGADAAPYFRVFNPLLQSRKFDPDGAYIRRWVPELAALDRKWIHEPAGAPPLVLEKAGVRIGETYPAPIVAHDKARRLALEAYAAMTKED